MTHNIDKFFDRYPKPFPFDVKERIKNGYRESFDIKNETNLIFPDLNLKKNIIKNVLIIGCGHTEGIYHALRNPKINFTCIDISEKAINSCKEISNKYDLGNIVFEKIDIINFNSKINFDIIYAKNVFQYLENPLDGFIKSYALLTETGALICSLSSFAHFSEIDNIRQDLLKFGYSYTNENDIEEAFNIVSGLDGFHPARLRMVQDNKYINKKDFVLRFLIPIHSSFTVHDIFNLCNASNFYFQCWYSNALYYPSSLLRKTSSRHPGLYNKINNLEIIDKWEAICNIFKSSNDRYAHSFILRKDSILENFELNLLDNVESKISLRKHLVIKKIIESQETYAISSNYKRKLSPDEITITSLLNNPIKLKNLYNSNDLNLDLEEINSVIKSLLESSIIYLSL